MGIDHAGELLEGLQPLPLQGRAPVLEELPSPSFATVAPELTERLLEEVGRLQTLIGFEQRPERPLAIQREVLPVGQQRVALPLDKLALVALEPCILAAAHFVHGLIQVAHRMKLVVQNRGAGHMSGARVAERFPHVHDDQPYLAALLQPQPLKEQIHARFRTVRAPKPDGAPPNQIAHHNAVRMPLADGQLVDPDDLRPRRPRPSQLLRHVLFFQRLDRLPVQMRLPGDIPDRRYTAPAPHPEGKPLRIEGIVGQPVQKLLFHLPAASAVYPANLHLQVDAPIPAGKVPNPTNLSIVKRPLPLAARAAERFFPRRRSRMTTAYGSPKTPAILCSGLKPGNW